MCGGKQISAHAVRYAGAVPVCEDVDALRWSESYQEAQVVCAEVADRPDVPCLEFGHASELRADTAGYCLHIGVTQFYIPDIHRVNIEITVRHILITVHSQCGCLWLQILIVVTRVGLINDVIVRCTATVCKACNQPIFFW